MDLNAPKTVSEPTLRRLPLYHRFLKDLEDSGKESVSCTDIGLELDLDPTQVRKDLEAVGIEGRPRVGVRVRLPLSAARRFHPVGLVPGQPLP